MNDDRSGGFPGIYSDLYNDYKKYFDEFIYVECDFGWYDLIRATVAELDRILKDIDSATLQIVTLKEKFGGLRMYYQLYDEELPSDDREVLATKIWNVVRDAEKRSYQICEVCGTEESVESICENRWIKTICKSCRK